MPKPKVLIAADTNVLLDYAKPNGVILECFSVISQRFPGSQIIVLPTVIQELTDIADSGDSEEVREWAVTALQKMALAWKFLPVNCVPVGHAIVESIGRKLREKGLIPDEECNDSFIVAEAALLNIDPNFQ